MRIKYKPVAEIRKIVLILAAALSGVLALWAQNKGGIRFGVISDVHVGITPVLGHGNNLCLQNAFDYFSDPRLHAAFVLVNGDFGDYGTQDEFDVFRRIRDQHLRIPLIATMGNHDANQWELFERATGSKGNAVHHINGYYFITISPGAGVLDRSTMRATERHTDKYDYIRDWLREQIAEAKAASKGKPVFIFGHHPVYENVGLDGLFDNDPQLVYFSGHIHLPNNSPLGIRQDKGFTEVNTAVTGLVAQGLLVEADPKGAIRITTQDFNRGQKVQEWRFNINKPLPYTNAIRLPQAKAPVFTPGTAVNIGDITTNSAVVSFKNAVIPLPNPVHDIVFSYRGELSKKSSGEQVKRLNFHPDLFADTVKQFLRGLEKNTEYEIRLYASDAWNKESAGCISATFSTLEKEAKPARPIDYTLRFDGDLSNGKHRPVQMYSQEVNPGLYDVVPHFDKGVHGQAIELSSRNFVALDTEDDLIDYGQSFSVAFWINIKSVREDGEAALLSNKNVNREYYNGYAFRTFDNKGRNFICLEYSPVNGTFARLPLAPTQPGQWMHLAATFDYVHNRIIVYVNGMPVQRVEADLSGGIGGIAGECPFKNTFLGSSPWNYSGERGGYNGCGKGNNDIRFLADDFVMSSRVFTHDDVAALLVDAGTTVYPAYVHMNKADHLRFVAEAPVTEESRQVAWRVEGATSSQTTITADGMLYIGADESAPALTVSAISSKGVKGASKVTVASPRTDGKINFGIITDVHVGGSANIDAGNNKRLADAFRFFNDPALKAERVVLTGDLSGNGNWLEMFIFRMIRQTTSELPLLAMMGNHEENKWENFERSTGNKPNEATIINGYHFISVSPGAGELDEATMRSTGESQSNYSYIRDWLEARIREAEAADPVKPIFVFQHHKVTGPDHDLYTMLRGHNRVIIFSGDTHDVNNHPLSIRQDGGFTWCHCGAVCSEAEFNNTSEGVYVEADAHGNVTIKTRDFTNNRWIEDQVWAFNVNKPLPYTMALRKAKAKAPVFAADATVYPEDVRVKSAVLAFDRPAVPANDVNDIIYKYRYVLTKKSNGKVVKDETEWADFCLYPMTKTKSIELKGLERSTAYTLKVYAIDAFDKQSKPLTGTFTTAAIDTIPRKPVDYVLHFDGSLKNDGIAPVAVKMFYLDAKPDVYDTIPHFEAGKHGQAIDLSKRNFITLDTNSDLIDYDQSFSIAFWMNIKMVRNDGGPGIVSNKNVDGDELKGYAFRTGSNEGANWLYLDITPTNSTHSRLWIAPTKIGEWMHVAATFDYDNNKITIYIDGKKVKEAGIDLSGGVGGITGIGRNKATFLGSTPWNYTEEHGGFNGGGTGGRNDIRFLADDFILTNRVLTPEEVSILLSPGMQVQTRQDFDLKRVAETSAIKHETVQSSIFGKEVLSVQADDKNSVLNLPVAESMDWKKAKYLVAEVYQPNEYTTLLNIRFFRKGESKEHPWIRCYITILPKLKTQVIFPLSYLDAQELYLPRFPRQLKGVCTGSRLDPEDIASVDIDVYPHLSPLFAAKLEIASVYITDKLPANYDAPAQTYVDEFGQWTGRDWPNKIHSEAELKQNVIAAEKAVAEAGFPEGWSRYGGLKALKFDATGFFRVQHDGERWWFVDPEGYAFLSSGICCITPSQSGVVQDMEDLLTWIPDENGPFAPVIEKQGRKRIDYFKANLMRVYGDKWLEKWEETTPKQLKAWRFNTVANWSDRNIQEKSGLPYLAHLHGLPYMKTMLYRDFHDVFSPDFREVCRQYAAQLIPGKDNPYIIGYFLGNEPHWAFGDNNIAYEMFATAQPSYTKLHFIERMKETYPDVAAFNSAWQLHLSSIDELSVQTFKQYPSGLAERDFRAFTVEMIEEWVRVQCEETRKADPNHLNLGTRYAFISSETMMKVGRYFDVFSLNAYTAPYPPATKELSEISGKPVLITEWHFGCGTDGGLPTPGLNTTISQKDRAAAYRVFAENGFARPEIIGFHWFQWADQNILGRGDGENFNIGFLDACSLPYPELTEAARETHEGMYDIARGRKKPYEYKFPPVPPLPAITE